MAEVSAPHPTAQHLSDFAQGRLTAAWAETVAKHLETCPDCVRAVSQVAGDSFCDLVRSARPSATQALGDPLVPASSVGQDLPPELANHSKFRIEKELGRGGMGVVYKAEHLMLGRSVAIKVITRGLSDHPDALKRFLQEVRAAGKLDHPHIVKALDADQAGNLHLLVMDFVDGLDLAEVLLRKGPLPVLNACEYIRQAALGLQHAHEQGMIHRDIKPKNLMLSRKGQVKILDFGLASMTGQKANKTKLTQVGSFMGTVEYMAPEQAEDATKADIRSDIYSLGCTLYCLLTGQPPFIRDTDVKTILAHLGEAARPLHGLRSDVPEKLSAVVAKMLAKEPGRRYQTPVEVAQALREFCKPGAKPVPVQQSPSPVRTSDRGTVLAGEAARGTEVKPSAPLPPKAVTPGPGASPFQDLEVDSAKPKQPKAPKKKENRPGVSGQAKWLIGGGIGVVVLLAVVVGMWAGGVFTVKTANGVLIVDVNEANPDVYVDGDKVTVTWSNGGKKAEISVKPGTPHEVELKKDGFAVYGERVTLKDGERQILTAQLASTSPKPPTEIGRGSPPAPPRDGFVSLFNGKNLAGWEVSEGDRNSWGVENGLLFTTGVGKNWLVTHDQYENVELRLDYRLTAKTSNSGLGMCLPKPTPTSSAGNIEVQIWEPEQPVPILPAKGENFTGALAHLKGITVRTAKPIGEWNHLHVVLANRKITVELNDKRVLEADFEEFKNNPNLRQELVQHPKGYLGLQNWGAGRVEFRNLEAKVLPASTPASQNPPPTVVTNPPIKPENPPTNSMPPVVENKGGSLFNGKDLTGLEGLAGIWKVENGSIIGMGSPEVVKGNNTCLCSKQKYKDFELKFQVLLKDGIGNTGVQIRSTLIDNQKYIVAGPQCDMGEGYWGSLYGERFSPDGRAPAGTMAAPKPEVVKKVVRPNDFNEFIIRCVGKHVMIAINGTVTVDDVFPRMPDEGIIAFQFHAGSPPKEVVFRNIEFTDLSQDFVSLFNGKDLTGWKVPGGGTGNWRVDKGAIVCTGPISFLFHERGDYKNFVYRVEAMINESGNSGQFFRTEFGPGLPNGYEAQIAVGGGDPATKTGSLYPRKGNLDKYRNMIVVNPAPHKADEWFTQEVTVIGNRIIIKVNDKVTLDWTDPENHYTRGHFALQHNSPATSVRFRKIEVKELPAKP